VDGSVEPAKSSDTAKSAGTREQRGSGTTVPDSYEAVSLACAVSSTGFGFVSTIVTVVTFVQSS